MSRFTTKVGLLLLVVLGAGGFICSRYYREQAHLTTLLQQLDDELSVRNDKAAVAAENFMKGMQEAVIKNQNQPPELALLHRSQVLENRVSLLLDTLRHCRDELRRASGNPKAPALLSHSNELGTVAGFLGTGTRGQRALRQQVAACTDTMHQLAPGVKQLLLPNFDHLPLAETLSALTQLESQLLACELATFQHTAKRIRVRGIPTQFIAAATSETNTVAAGSTYLGSLLLVKSLQVANVRMFCNGRPVFVDANGVGQIQFRAPTRPGPATWLGTIHFNISGRDTAFQTQVSYRVAHP